MRLSEKFDFTWPIYVGVPLLLTAVYPLLSPFQKNLVTEIMIWAIFAVAYNLLFGHVGLISLGHSMFFGSGMFAAALSLIHLKTNPWAALAIALSTSAMLSAAVGFLALRVRGVYFLIVTLIFSLTFHLAALNQPDITGGDQGLVVDVGTLPLGPLNLNLQNPAVSYYLVLVFFALTLGVHARIAVSPFGLALEGIKENEERMSLLGYNVWRYKLYAFVVSGTFSGLSGALFVFAFRFAGPQLMDITVSVNVLLWTLLGGAGTLLGPVVGVFLLIPLIDLLSSTVTGYLMVVGGILLAAVMLGSAGLVAELKKKVAP